MIDAPKRIEKTIRKNGSLTKEKEILIEISANWPSNNWPQEINFRHLIQVRNRNGNFSL